MIQKVLRARFVIPVWGRKYVNVMTDVTIPSLLAAGNIPALAKEMEVEFIFLTQKDSVPIIKASRPVQALEEYSRVRFIYIDDLIGPVYGIVLTKAYFRSVIDEKETAKDYHYFFLNVDSIIADGSYANILTEIKSGRNLIFAPGLRVNGPPLIAALKKKNDSAASQVMAVRPRLLAQLALGNLHKTVLAQRQSHPLTYLERAYQFYWQNSPDTIHMSQFLMANVCFKPTQIPDEAPCYVDYCIAEVFAPDDPITVIDDSDRFLLVEPQDPAWMGDEIRAGYPPESWFAKEFSGWLTRQHLELGRTICTVHTGDLDKSDEALRHTAFEFVERIQRDMSVLPIKDHPYWVSGVKGYIREKQRLLEPPGLPEKEFAHFEDPIVRIRTFHQKRTALRKLYHALFGLPPRYSILHPLLTNYCEVFKFADRQDTGRILRIIPRESAFWRLDPKSSETVVFEYFDLDMLISADGLAEHEVAQSELFDAMRASDRILFIGPHQEVLRIPEIAAWLNLHSSAETEIGILFFGSYVNHLCRFEEPRLARAMEIEGCQGRAFYTGSLPGLIASQCIDLAQTLYQRRRFFRMALVLPAIAVAVAMGLPFNFLKVGASRWQPGIGTQSLFLALRKYAGSPDIVHDEGK